MERDRNNAVSGARRSEREEERKRAIAMENGDNESEVDICAERVCVCR